MRTITQGVKCKRIKEIASGNNSYGFITTVLFAAFTF